MATRKEAGYVIGENGKAICPGVVCRCYEPSGFCPMHGRGNMPHWDANGREEWVCQKGAHVCTGPSTWVERGSTLAERLGCSGNVCADCLYLAEAVDDLTEGE